MELNFSPALGLLCFLLAACGGKSLDADSPEQGGSGGGNQAGAAAAGSAQGGSSGSGQGGLGTGGSSMGGVGSGGNGGTACSDYDDAPPGFIPVEIINKTTSPIHLGQELLNCGVEPLFEVSDDGGRLATGRSCQPSCDTLRAGGPVGCPAICAYPSTLTLAPGEVYVSSWDARYIVQAELPAECDVGYGRACARARRIEPGTFTFSAHGGSTIDCSLAPSGKCGSCQPMASGGCMTPASLIGGKLEEADTTVVLDASYGIYGAAQPAPRPPEPGSSGAAPLPRAVQIIFGG